MSILIATAGLIVIAMALTDAYWTTLSLQGAAPISGRIARLLWEFNLLVPSKIRQWWSPAIGTFILLAVMCVWIFLLWTGWWLLFTADPNSVINSSTKVPVGHVDRIYFVGFAVFTLGVGDVIGSTPGWRVASVLCSGTGLILVTLSITYLVPVLSAVMKKRETAGLIHSLGASPSLLVAHAWDGESFSQLPGMLEDIRQDIEEISQQHLAYPVLHYFHTAVMRDEFSLALASLDDALTMLHLGIPEPQRPHESVYQPIRDSIGNLLLILRRDFIKPAAEAPPAPSLASLSDAGIPIVPIEQFQASVRDESLSKRRCQLRGFVHDAGWNWEHVLTEKLTVEEISG